MKKIIFAATSSGVGKTTIASGLMRALKNRGLKVQPFKVGPDYIDTGYHQIASGQISRNLDEFMLPEEEIKYIFAKNTKEADIAIIEGVMGLYDGLGATQDCSTASMSKILESPIILIIDGRAMAASAAALVLGFKSLDPSLKIVGVIANNVSSDNHFNIIKKVVEEKTGIALIGRIPKDPDFHLGSRQLGLNQAWEKEDLEDQLDYIAGILEKHIDLDQLLELAESPDLIYNMKRRDSIRGTRRVRLALAYDQAFNFYYQDALDLLEEMGVELAAFSPIKDQLPQGIDGIFLGGGYPELYAQELAQNQDLLREIKRRAQEGMPIYAECGGLMYLGKKLYDQEGKAHQMVGILEGSSQMQNRLQRFGYCQARIKTDLLLGTKGSTLRGHEFHYSNYSSQEETVLDLEKTMVDGSLKTWTGGYIYKNTFASYLHIHLAGNYQMAQNFVKNMEEYKENNKRQEADSSNQD